MPRIFLPKTIITIGSSIIIKDEKARYISNVLRCSSGDTLIITDDKGYSFSAEITNSSKKELTVKIKNKNDFNAESTLQITLLQGILKGDKMDLVIQKATELGIHDIFPVVTERSQLRYTKKIDRWRKIAEEASRQSGRNLIPEIHEIIKFGNLFDNSIITGKGIIFWEEGGEKLSNILNRFNHPDKLAVFTGPEGGFTEKEVRTASQNDFIIATLGKRILRAETAAISALSIVQYELGDLGNFS